MKYLNIELITPLFTFQLKKTLKLPDMSVIRQLPDAGYPATVGRIIRHAGYPAKLKIRPDNPALPDIRPDPNFN